VRNGPEPPLTQFEDHALIALCLEGDEAAWEALVRRYQRLIYSIPLKTGLGEEVAADVFQSVCVRLVEHLGALKDRAKLASWLITTTTRECWRTSNRRRREAPIGEGGDEDGSTLPEVADERPLPEHEHLRIEEQERVRQAVDALPDRCRTLIELLYYAEDRPSYEEISRRLEMPVPSIGPTRARCLQKLRRMMEDGVQGRKAQVSGGQSET
jgi:RNA polymerase sigma factor (sigma-70 family)